MLLRSTITPCSASDVLTASVCRSPSFGWTTVGAQITTAKPADAAPLMDAATAAIGTATDYAREDHVHPMVPAVRYDAAQTLTPAQQSLYRNAFACLKIDDGLKVQVEFPGSEGAAQVLFENNPFLYEVAHLTRKGFETIPAGVAGFLRGELRFGAHLFGG